MFSLEHRIFSARLSGLGEVLCLNKKSLFVFRMHTIATARMTQRDPRIAVTGIGHVTLFAENKETLN